MPKLKRLLRPEPYFRFLRFPRFLANLRGATFYPPGHFYSPLIDVEQSIDGIVPHDGEDMWEAINLRQEAQRAYYQDLVSRFLPLDWPHTPGAEFRAYLGNDQFNFSDAFTLSAIIRREQPRHIIEVGSGFSTAVTLDTLDHIDLRAAVHAIDPYPARLLKLLRADDARRVTIVREPVQRVPIEIFDQLRPQDILFIDSSHVAKAGSDVAFLMLRVLPRLKPGVLVHVHDVFFPESYPATWIKQGRAWNESLIVRAVLANSARYEVVALNSFAAKRFPDVFSKTLPRFLENPGGSLWLRVV